MCLNGELKIGGGSGNNAFQNQPKGTEQENNGNSTGERKSAAPRGNRMKRKDYCMFSYFRGAAGIDQDNFNTPKYKQFERAIEAAIFSMVKGGINSLVRYLTASKCNRFVVSSSHIGTSSYLTAIKKAVERKNVCCVYLQLSSDNCVSSGLLEGWNNKLGSLLKFLREKLSEIEIKTVVLIDDFDRRISRDFRNGIINIAELKRIRREFIQGIQSINENETYKYVCLAAFRKRSSLKNAIKKTNQDWLLIDLKKEWTRYFYGREQNSNKFKLRRNAFFAELLCLMQIQGLPCDGTSVTESGVFDSEYEALEDCNGCRYRIERRYIDALQLDPSSINSSLQRMGANDCEYEINSDILADNRKKIDKIVSDALESFFDICDSNLYYLWHSLMFFTYHTNICTVQHPNSIDESVKGQFMYVWGMKKDKLKASVTEYRFQEDTTRTERHKQNAFFDFLEMLPLYLPKEVKNVEGRKVPVDTEMYKRIYEIAVRWLCSMLVHRSDDGDICTTLSRWVLKKEDKEFLQINKNVRSAIIDILADEEVIYRVKNKKSRHKKQREYTLDTGILQKFNFKEELEYFAGINEKNTVMQYQLNTFVNYIYSDKKVFNKNKKGDKKMSEKSVSVDLNAVFSAYEDKMSEGIGNDGEFMFSGDDWGVHYDDYSDYSRRKD